MTKTSVELCTILDLPKISDPRGNLTFIEGKRQIPFAIQRVFYLYDVPGGSARGGHAHKDLDQLKADYYRDYEQFLRLRSQA